MRPRIYLDHAATTPIRAEARAAVAEGMARWANPSSPHGEGRAARAALEDARERIGAALGWDHELIFTSGATEAALLALRGGRAIMRAGVEHDAVIRAAGDAAELPTGPDGEVCWRLFPEFVDSVGRPILVALQHANNETGVLQRPDPLDRAQLRALGGLWFADCAQSAGKLPLPDADLVAVSAHKLGGPPGIGALLVRDLAMLTPTGGQERGYRAGTENLPAALGFAAALEAPRDWFAGMETLRTTLDDAIQAAGGAVVARESARIATIAAYRMPGVPAAAQLIALDLAGFAVSAGSACSSGSMRSSHVLAAMGWDEAAAREVIRVSFGWATTAAEVAAFADAWAAVAARARRRAA